MNQASSISDLIDQSLVLERAGDVSAAFQQARRALDQARILDQPAVIAGAQNCLATLHFRTGHHAEASAFASEVLGVASPDSPAFASAACICHRSGCNSPSQSARRPSQHKRSTWSISAASK